MGAAGAQERDAGGVVWIKTSENIEENIIQSSEVF